MLKGILLASPILNGLLNRFHTHCSGISAGGAGPPYILACAVTFLAAWVVIPSVMVSHSVTSCSQVEEPPDEFDMGWLGDFIDRLSEFDREMNQVVVDSGKGRVIG